MLNARKKLATLAVASALSGGALMVSAPAQAVNVSQNGLGEVLLFPYYTVKNGFDTIFSVVNTTNATSILKIRFREALDSRDVRDFNVIMSPYDTWNGVVTLDPGKTTSSPSGVANTGGALMRTWDKTCTAPQLFAGDNGATEISFTNADYSGASDDGGPAGNDRQQEGYFEIFVQAVSRDESGAIETAALHGANGVPANCASVAQHFAIGTFGVTPTGSDMVFDTFAPPLDTVKGHVTYINVAKGVSFDAEPTAIENFRNTCRANGSTIGCASGLAPNDLIFAPSDTQPNVNTGDVYLANILVHGTPVTKTMTARPLLRSADAVSSALTVDTLINEYASGSGAATSWVVTFPTKHVYADNKLTAVIPPFENLYTGVDTACDQYGITYWNREEKTTTTPQGVPEFSPYVPGTNPVSSLCYEANVIDFNGSTMFGSGSNHEPIDTTAVGTSGWAMLGFPNLNGNIDNDATITGKPAIGFAAINRDTGGAAVNYGSTTAHSSLSGLHEVQ